MARFSETVGKTTDRPGRPICKHSTDGRALLPKKNDRSRFSQKPPIVEGGGGGSCPGGGQLPGGGAHGFGPQQRLREPQPITGMSRAINATATNKRDRFMMTTSWGLPAA